MTAEKSFPEAAFLSYLELMDNTNPPTASMPLSSLLARLLLTSDGTGKPTRAADYLTQLLHARKATLQAALDTEMAADELRRYQKFAKPGQPSPHIVQLRQRQAAARQATSVSKLAYVKAASAFVREAGIDVPPRVAIEPFISDWIDANVPKASAP